ncbi:hypothetical protein F444_02044 [Phytophthora nicotianae P1976]|uniref:PiggyBac transposable element-derived protein domain-containing protein n=2 Tax=Phytophthora nicotianae TaxID=4792 RepID=A0A081AYQ3_PHYNI|nr:hypothetical protein F444_02044 [Phytophthora nicotianae P1976]
MPYRVSTRTKAQAQAAPEVSADVDVRDVNFTTLWRQLTAEGWTSKRPTRLQMSLSYYSPEAAKDSPVEGVNMFTGEAAVVKYAVAKGIVATAANLEASEDDTNCEDEANRVDEANREDEANRKDEASRQDVNHEDLVNREGESVTRRLESLFGSDSEEEACKLNTATEDNDDEHEIVTASQIDTTVALSANTVDAMFGGAQSEDEEAAVMMASLCDAPPLASSFPATSPPADPVTPTMPTREPVVTDPANPLVPPNPDDVNVMKDDDVADDYESIDSSSDGTISSGEDDVTTQQPEADVSSDEDETSELMDAAFIDCLGGSLAIEDMDQSTLRSMAWTTPSTHFESNASSFDGLSRDVARPSVEIMSKTDSPLDLLLFFMPKKLWTYITRETNRYKYTKLDEKAKLERARLVREGQGGQSLRDIRRRLRAEPDYSPREILQVMGLLVAHMLSPTRPFSDHWAMVGDGALPSGTFGQFLARNRCTSILSDLHFCNNDTANKRDKLWKLRAVVDVIQDRFLKAWSVSNVISFDEGVLPATSKRNSTRMFMPDKPHRYGTKMFMTCDSRTAYCHRFEVYVGKRQAQDSAQQVFDHKTGAAAVIRNLKAVLGETYAGFRIIVVDRFYTSVALALQLLSMSVYMVGTIMTSRLGFDKEVVEKRKTRPSSINRGSFKFSRSVAVPTMVACHWWDRKPVHYLATGVSMAEDKIRRNLKAAGQSTFPCPKLVTDYQRWMGGVDVHDQLRLQTYSVQTAFRFRKYYKGLFLGLFDLALVNAYITHKEASRIRGTNPVKRLEWFKMLHKQLLQVTDDYFTLSTPEKSPCNRKRRRKTSHQLKQLDDWVVVSGVQKRRQRACKVCSLYRGEQKKSFQTTFYCEDCSKGDAKFFLCPKARRGTDTTCFQVWHDDFEYGAAIPSHLGKRVVLRRAPKAAGVHKSTRREPQEEKKEE